MARISKSILPYTGTLHATVTIYGVRLHPNLGRVNIPDTGGVAGICSQHEGCSTLQTVGRVHLPDT